MSTIPLLSLAAIASAAWILLSRRLPAARPVAVALVLSTAAGAARVAGVPVRIDMFFYAAQPLLGAWLAWRVLLRSSRWRAEIWFARALAVLVLVVIAPLPASWWRALPGACWVLGVLVETLVVARWLVTGPSEIRGELTGGGLSAGAVPDLAVLVLSACDAAVLAEIAAGDEAWVLSQAAAWIPWALVLAIGCWGIMTRRSYR